MTEQNHAPDGPFGCTTMWGPPVLFPDMGLHVCNRDHGHRGKHRCKCGADLAGRPT